MKNVNIFEKSKSNLYVKHIYYYYNYYYHREYSTEEVILLYSN